MKHDDLHIIKEVLGGKSEQFEHILNRYSGQIFNLIAHIVPCKEDAEELTQDVFIKVFRQLSSFKEESSFSTWIYRIATNTAISAARKRKHDTLHLDDAVYKTSLMRLSMKHWTTAAKNNCKGCTELLRCSVLMNGP